MLPASDELTADAFVALQACCQLQPNSFDSEDQERPFPTYTPTDTFVSATENFYSETMEDSYVDEETLAEERAHRSIKPFPGQPKPYGYVHSTVQQVDATVHDVESLRLKMRANDPLLEWQTRERRPIDESNLKTWFPKDNHVAFYTRTEGTRSEYDQLTYHELHEQLEKCPPFMCNSDSPTNVAMLLPIDQMAHMATTLLSIIGSGAVAVPLDPRMPTLRVLEAMKQLECTAFVAPKSVLAEGELPLLKLDEEYKDVYRINPALFKICDTKENKRLVSYFQNQVQELRLLRRGACGKLDWTVLATQDGKTWTPKETTKAKSDGDFPPLRHSEDTAMLLRTSGTTNKPKVVPISLSMLAFAGTSIAAALRLKRNDCNCNSMPFFHIGGIACNLLAVLMTGGSVIMAGPLTDPNAFLDHIVTDPTKHSQVTVTWYYAGPSMHKAIVLTAESRLQGNSHCLPNNLRFVRSASAHLNHDLALRLSKIFHAQVIPTYGMSEAMPICSSAPIDVRFNPPCEVVDSVGYSVGTSIRILDPETDEVLKYGDEQIGEISVKGAGVITNYVGLDTAKTHTPGGWLKTGDRGMLDKQGRLFIKGRSKEMIKRGGEQVWPNEIDDVIEKVDGVATAVTFGVPNELWGEEVAVAVVLKDGEKMDDQAYLSSLEENVMETCRAKLDQLSMPSQIKFLPSTSSLLKGSTGKYIRSKMADHLQVTAVDTGALNVLEKSSQIHKLSAVPENIDEEPSFCSESDDVEEGGFWNSRSPDGRRVIASDALNGLRFLVACFVVQVHVGEYPNLAWVKLQTYQPNMIVFFGIGAFQIASSVARSVKGRWAHFVGSKIGSLHTLFVISQLYTLPSYILFMAFDEEGTMDWGVMDWIRFSSKFVFSTLTGMGHGFDVNKYTWFQSTFYVFLMLFPFMDDYLRRLTAKVQGIYLVLFSIAAAGLWGLMYLVLPADIFWGPAYPFGWSIVTWLPLLVAGMLAAYFFRRLAEHYMERRKKDLEALKQEQSQDDDPDSLYVEDIEAYTKIWGYATDFCSLLLLGCYVGVALAPNCLCVYGDTYDAMRPGEEIDDVCPIASGRDDYVWACDITLEEFEGYIKDDPHHKEYGRFPSTFSGALGYMRLSAPLFLFWIAAMGFGNGLTARFFRSKLMTALAPLGYPVYLLQMGTARYYWLATRGFNSWEPWWDISGEYPFPVEWYEMYAILAIVIALGFFVNLVLVPPLMPYSISIGVKVCKFVSKCVKCVTCQKPPVAAADEEPIEDSKKTKASSYNQVRRMVRGLTGMEVTRSMQLKHLGLDSLGATALLGMLRASVPAAKNLTLSQLQQCSTVGCLAEVLDDSESITSEEDE